MIDLSIADVATRFPDFRVAVLLFESSGIPLQRTRRIEDYVAETMQICRARWNGTELSAIPGVAAWRRAYKGFGIKSTSYRSSVERLVKRVLAGDEIPRINAFVDLYNAVSLAHVLCLGADDLDRIQDPINADLAFRFARDGDSFIDMAPAEGLPAEQPPKSGEVVYAAGSTVLCRRWNWRQDARSVVGAQTRRIVLTIQSNGEGSVEAAAEALSALASSELAMTCKIAIADSAHPRVQLS
jgi:DNA/RNA-binding domain of Phe-tRNA-synthetase-like protein